MKCIILFHIFLENIILCYNNKKIFAKKRIKRRHWHLVTFSHESPCISFAFSNMLGAIDQDSEGALQLLQYVETPIGGILRENRT